MVVLGDSTTRGLRSFSPSARLELLLDASDVGWGAIVGENQEFGLQAKGNSPSTSGR